MSKKRQYRRLVSGILIALLACNIGLMISIAVFRYGVYDQALLMRSFEQSSYFEEKFNNAQAMVAEVLKENGLSDSVFSLNNVKMSFERRMRSQVLNRSDAAAELSSISVAKTILDSIEKQSMKTTLKAEEGIILLSQKLSRILLEQSEIPGVEKWYEDAEHFLQKASVFMLAVGTLAAADIAAIVALQSIKHKIFIKLAAGLSGAGFIGTALSVTLFMVIGIGRVENQVIAVYYQNILLVGLKISAAVLVIAAILGVLGLAIKKMQQAF